MFVRSLRMAGFKSFADPTTMEFDRGVTAIVGPNGSGKSNIADALMWVLGAQAPSALRGGAMDDVIFAGSQARPRLGVAEVELTLDNSDGVLPLEVAEATITRTADRSGASEYRINGAACRLLDIAELLSDTGVGRSLHTIVGQGALDQVLQARPEERRMFIEEAAQIGKYRRRKDRALRKIERVDDNLLRLKDVASELRRSLRPLERQALAAERHSELLGQQRDLRQQLAATELHGIDAAEVALEPSLGDRRTELLADELEHVRATVKVVGSQREELGARAARTLAVTNAVVRAGDRLAALARVAGERTQRLAARLEAETEEGYRERIRLLTAERDRWSAAATSLGADATASRERASDAALQVTAAADEERAAEVRLARARTAETAASQELVRAEGAEAAGRATLASARARAEAARERRDLAERGRASAATAVGGAAEEVRALQSELDTAIEAAAAAEARHEEARGAAESLRATLGDRRASGAAAAARLDALTEVIDRLSGLPEARRRLDPLLADAHERLVVAASDEDDARRAVADALSAVEDRWAEVAACDDRLRHLDALMAGAADRLGGARRALDAREVELATLDEELARAQEAIASGERATAEDRAGIPARQAALEAAGDDRAEAEGALKRARAAAAEARRIAAERAADARLAEERSLAARLRVEEAEGGIEDARAALAGLADLRAALEVARARAAEAGRSARRAAERADAWAAQAQAHAEAADGAAAASEQRLASLRSREADLVESLQEAQRKRNEAEVRRAELRARRTALTERAAEEWGLTEDGLRAVPALDAAGRTAAQERVAELEGLLRRIGPVNPRAQQEHEELAERDRWLKDQMSDLEASRSGLLEVVRDVNATIVSEFRTAFADVAREFEAVFGRLFPGGRGSVRLERPEDVLSSGIEVEARPAGKRISKLSLLSGGERSLVALAFLFAIFRARPSPFYVLDEVEAALDDVNLQRWLGLVAELRGQAQVLIVTHQKRTMEAADVLYGVSMGSGGTSQVIAKRLEGLPA